MNLNKAIGWCLILMFCITMIHYFIIILQEDSSLLNSLCVFIIGGGSIFICNSVYRDRIKGK